MKRMLVGLAALLASCAPSQTGGGASSPQVAASPLSPVSLRPGQTVYVQYTYPRSAVEVADSYFEGLKIDFNNRDIDNVRSVSAPASWLSMTVQDSPQGVDVSLARAFVVKDITKTTNASTSTEVNFFERVRVVLKVAAAPTAAATSKVTTLIYSDGKTRSEVPLLVQVDAGATRSASVQ